MTGGKRTNDPIVDDVNGRTVVLGGDLIATVLGAAVVVVVVVVEVVVVVVVEVLVLLSSSFVPQHTPKRNPLAQMPNLLPSALIHSQVETQTPGSMRSEL